MQHYNPFGTKKREDLTSADLAVLRTVAEGWFVEFKVSAIDPAALAKSVSAFANTHGGWLFIGVDEDPVTRKAASFPGLSADHLAQALMRLRDSIAAHLSPAPFFEWIVLSGPDESSGLASEQSIIAVEIPVGQNPPYLHSSGRIYRRIGDRSDPVPETDRAQLDILYRRSRRSGRVVRRFLKSRPLMAKGGKNPMLHLFIMARPEQHHDSKLKFSRFADLMSGSLVPFPNCCTTQDGFLARQRGAEPFAPVLEWRYFRPGRHMVSVPFSCARGNGRRLAEFLQGYAHVAPFLEVWPESTVGAVIDLNISFHLLLAVFARAAELTREDGGDPNVLALLAVDNADGFVPFLDTSEYISHIRTFGLPIVQDALVEVPPLAEYTWHAFRLDLGFEEEPTPRSSPGSGEAAIFFAECCRALGVPVEIPESHDGQVETIKTWNDVNLRAVEVMQRRSDDE